MFFNMFISLTSTVSHSPSLVTEVPTMEETAPTCSLKFLPVVRESFFFPEQPSLAMQLLANLEHQVHL